ncbi:hypothetical protein JOH51_001510 [Rhizobium leguminosarum]|nr:hypothetical protein [Rhizobium leguminosarum]
MDPTERVQRHGNELWGRLKERGATPKFLDDRPLRPFSLGEVAEILGVSGSYLRQLSIDGLGPTPELGTAGRRSYTLRQINELRAYLASARPKEALKLCPRRREGEKLQIISVADGPASIEKNSVDWLFEAIWQLFNAPYDYSRFPSVERFSLIEELSDRILKLCPQLVV